MHFRSSVVSKLVSSSKALLLVNPVASQYGLSKNSPHSCLPLVFSKTLLMSEGTEIAAYLPIMRRCVATSRGSYTAVSVNRRPPPPDITRQVSGANALPSSSELSGVPIVRADGGIEQYELERTRGSRRDCGKKLSIVRGERPRSEPSNLCQR